MILSFDCPCGDGTTGGKGRRMEEFVMGREENLVGIFPGDDPFGLLLRLSSSGTYGHFLAGEHVRHWIGMFCPLPYPAL